MASMQERRVCGKNNCAGEKADLIIDRGKKNQHITVIFTAKGNFHAVVRTEKGQESLKVRLEGPKRLDSGPFRRIDIYRGQSKHHCAGGRGQSSQRLLVNRCNDALLPLIATIATSSSR